MGEEGVRMSGVFLCFLFWGAAGGRGNAMAGYRLVFSCRGGIMMHRLRQGITLSHHAVKIVKTTVAEQFFCADGNHNGWARSETLKKKVKPCNHCSQVA